MNTPENRWLPPSPHKEEILKRIARGRAHIEERGHNVPPLLVFEDGGVIELPKVRYEMTRRGMELVAVDDASTTGQTKHNDVCGSIDELKGMLTEQPEVSEASRVHFDHLMEDVCYMVGRMQRRRENYGEFAQAVVALSQQLAEVTGPETSRVPEQADAIRALLSQPSEDTDARNQEVFELAEAIRDVANELEDCLSAYRKAAVELGTLYASIRGARNWE